MVERGEAQWGKDSRNLHKNIITVCKIYRETII